MKLTWSEASVFAFVWACALGYIVASRILEWNFERFLPSNWYFVVKKRLAQPEAKSLRTEKVPKKISNVLEELLTLMQTGNLLSGGNVQKVLVGREITSAPKVLLTAYAVRGLDIHSSYTIYNLINNQKKQNVAVVYVGEDLDVLVELCDRILVLCSGKVSGIVPGRGADKREIGMMMTRVGGNEHE